MPFSSTISPDSLTIEKKSSPKYYTIKRRETLKCNTWTPKCHLHKRTVGVHLSKPVETPRNLRYEALFREKRHRTRNREFVADSNAWTYPGVALSKGEEFATPMPQPLQTDSARTGGSGPGARRSFSKSCDAWGASQDAGPRSGSGSSGQRARREDHADAGGADELFVYFVFWSGLIGFWRGIYMNMMCWGKV